MHRFHFQSRWWDIVWLIFLMIYILSGITIVPLHGDEPTIIFMARDYYYEFVEGDLEKVYWRDPPLNYAEQDLRGYNGTIANRLYGLAAHLGGYGIDDLNEQWDWGADYNYNQQFGHIPVDDLLYRARLVSALFTAFGVLLIFRIGEKLGGRRVAWFVSFYYAFHPVLLMQGRRAVQEGVLIFSSLLVVLAAIWFLQNRRWWTALLLAGASGLALASKHTNAFMLIAVYGACLVYPAIQYVQTREINIPQWLRHVFTMIGIGFLSLVVFWILNPTWWTVNPIEHTIGTLRSRQGLLAGQVEVFGGYEDFADQFRGFLEHTLIANPQYFEVESWNDYDAITAEVENYEASILRGISIGGSIIGGIIFAGMIIAGFAQIILKQLAEPASWIVLIWAIVMILVGIFLTPIEWQRYYVPVYPAIGLLGALGLSIVIDWILKQLRITESSSDVRTS